MPFTDSVTLSKAPGATAADPPVSAFQFPGVDQPASTSPVQAYVPGCTAPKLFVTRSYTPFVKSSSSTSWNVWKSEYAAR